MSNTNNYYFKYSDAVIKSTSVGPSETITDQTLSIVLPTSNILPGSWSSIPATTTWELHQPVSSEYWRQITPSEVYIPIDPIKYVPEIFPGSQCKGCGQEIGTGGHCYNLNCYYNIKKLDNLWADPVKEDDLRGFGGYSSDMEYNDDVFNDEYFRGLEKEIQVKYPSGPEIAEQFTKAIKEAKPKRTRYPSYKKNDRVQTPEGPGNVWSIDRDGIVCIELDKDPSILHEFEKKELKKIK